MECTASRILITGYIDNELSGDEIQQLKTHLATCEECVAYLQKMEQVKTVFKRYHLLQEIPAGSPDFARAVTQSIQATITSEPQPSILMTWLQTYRAFVLRFVDSWISSLRARPVTWVTSVSCLMIFLLGPLFVDITRTLPFQPSASFVAVAPTEQAVTDSNIQQPALKGREAEPSPASTPFILAFEDNAGDDEGQGIPEFIQFSEDAVVHVAKTNTAAVNRYVYSHVLEAAQGQLLDSAVFAGYVQDALFQ
jgi:hypothetical protein